MTGLGESRGGLSPLLDGIDLVVFDKDGTLISFDAMWVGWTRELGARLEATTRRPVSGDVFAAIGFDPVAGAIAPGGPMAIGTMAEIEDRVAAVLRRWCPSVTAARRALAEAWFEPDPVALAVPLADLADLFGAIRASGRRIAVATTDDRGPTERTLAGLDLAGSVAALACGDDDAPHKPDPAVLTGLCARLDVPIERAAIVGDAPADLRMGRAAGVGRVLGVLSGVGGRDDLEPHADAILDGVGGLLAPS